MRDGEFQMLRWCGTEVGGEGEEEEQEDGNGTDHGPSSAGRARLASVSRDGHVGGRKHM